MESILTSVKKLCGGIREENTSFDDEIIMYINSIFLTLNQLKVGTDKVFRIEDDSACWSDFISEDDPVFEICKVYVGSKVRLRFDPPTNSSVMQALTETIKECEWRINEQTELK